jgi:hypothetical protein
MAYTEVQNIERGQVLSGKDARRYELLRIS